MSAGAYAIVVAAGSGRRMKSDVPKQFMLLNREPVLMHSVRNFAESRFKPEIVLVLPPEDLETWTDLCKTYSFHLPVKVCAGGADRMRSVFNGLEHITNASLSAMIAVHDGVRPLANTAFIDQMFEEAMRYESAVPVLSCRDSVRIVTGRNGSQKSSPIDREQLRMVQTPQVFRFETLKKSFETAFSDRQSKFTDEATMVEHAGYSVHLSEGLYENIKITYSVDLLVAESLIK